MTTKNSLRAQIEKKDQRIEKLRDQVKELKAEIQEYNRAMSVLADKAQLTGEVFDFFVAKGIVSPGQTNLINNDLESKKPPTQEVEAKSAGAKVAVMPADDEPEPEPELEAVTEEPEKQAPPKKKAPAKKSKK